MNKNKKDFIKLINKLKPFGAEVSACIIDLQTGKGIGYNENEFIYPASVYKIFIAAEVLRQVEIGKIKLKQKVRIKSPNDIDNEARFYPTAHFPVLKSGDTVDVETLLKLMLQRSDNTASNVLIDLIGRENISKNIINANGWNGSDVTRKFLNRAHEKKKYRYVDITKTCAQHLAEFMQKLDANKLVSLFVSKNLKKYMSDGSKKDTLSDQLIHRQKENWLGDVLFEKGGWFQVRTRNPLQALKWGGFFIRHQAQAAIVQINGKKYAVGILSKYSTFFPRKYFKFFEITKWLAQ